jgi:SAM-dependent methyltransferase
LYYQERSVTMGKHCTDDGTSALTRILDLSWRISAYAPPMKPFLRFSKHADTLYKGKTNSYKHFFRDFDDALQRALLGMARTIATPAEIAEACIERWKIDLEKFYQRSKRELEELRTNGEVPQFRYTPRDEFVFSRVEHGSRLLYVGCGAGTECLGWAQRGYEVIGIDTDEQLVGIANEWAEYLKLPFQAVCMDVDHIGFSPGSFDGCLLEFYGFQPSLVQALALQSGLASALNENGKGFVVATRKKYASFWFRMSNLGYPGSMFHWLKSQCRLDHCFSQMDACEEKFAFGLYIRSHTVDSLSRELAGVFDVQECLYEEHDSRYVISVVKRRGGLWDSPRTSGNGDSEDWTKHECLQGEWVSIEDLMYEIQATCDLLELHKERVERVFLNGEVSGGKSPLSTVDTDLPGFIELLEHIYGMGLSRA